MTPTGNRVLLERIEKRETDSGIILANPYGATSNFYLVLAVGPGEWLRDKKGRKKQFVSPEVEPGDAVLSNHWFDNKDDHGWHKSEYLDHADGQGRCIVDARHMQAKWTNMNTTKIKGAKPPTPQPPVAVNTDIAAQVSGSFDEVAKTMFPDAYSDPDDQKLLRLCWCVAVRQTCAMIGTIAIKPMHAAAHAQAEALLGQGQTA